MTTNEDTITRQTAPPPSQPDQRVSAQPLRSDKEEMGGVQGTLPWLFALIPLGLLAAMIAFFILANPLRDFSGNLPPIESLTVQRVEVTPDGFRFGVVNGGPEDVTISQAIVDGAFWRFNIAPSATIPRLGTATVTMQYPWVEGEPHAITLVTSTGTTFEGEVGVAVETPQPGAQQFLTYGLLGVFVGVIPVALGLAWFPAMRRLGRKGLNVVLALTVGLLVFLLVDTLLEAFEVSALLPEVYQGVPLTLFAAFLTWLGISAVSARGAKRNAGGDPTRQRLFLATLIALSIGLHNLGEGLAIGAAFALGEAALGSFLVIGFTLHNITEGVGIAAPLVKERPRLWQLALLALLAGLPASIGAWIGGFAYSPILAVIFLGIGVGAIFQVIIEVGRLLLRDAEKVGETVMNWANVSGLAAGIAIMYFTAFFVKF